MLESGGGGTGAEAMMQSFANKVWQVTVKENAKSPMQLVKVLDAK